mmetsp:Transcript_10226/g.24438  ORF Transcript_10226/g.24438 Transcript_10226/m.24438 type:complete len:548 (+) Transcript_10226:75-1718(+)
MIVYAYFSDHEYNPLKAIDGTLPNNVSNVLVSSDRNEYSVSAWNQSPLNQGPLNEVFDCTTLTKMINQSSTKIETITVCKFEEVSSAYLKMLMSIFNKANGLTFGKLGGDEAYACFQSSMVQQNGLRELEVYSLERRSTLQAQLIFEGVALSTSLEKLKVSGLCTEEVEVVTALLNALERNHRLKHLEVFDCESMPDVPTHHALLLFEQIALSNSLEKLKLDATFEDDDQVGTALVNVLERNGSLNYLDVDVSSLGRGTTIQDIFKTAILDTKVQELALGRDVVIGEDVLIAFDDWIDTLCRDDCSLERLKLLAIEPSARARSVVSDKELSTMKNTSVKEVELRYTTLDCSRFMETFCRFKSIEVLNLANNCISVLSPLDPLLIGGSATLRSLNLTNNDISEENAIEFFQKLSQMKRLRHMGLAGNPFLESESWMDVFSNAGWQNKSMECISFRYSNWDRQDYSAIAAIANVPLSLNRGGRRALEIDESSKPLPAGLWSHVLERAATLFYYDAADVWGHDPSLDSTRADVVFWLLKEKMAGNGLLER